MKAKLYRKVESTSDGRYRLPPYTLEERWMQEWALPGPTHQRQPRVSFGAMGGHRSWPPGRGPLT